MKEIKAYVCDHCGKAYKYRGTALNHEEVCRKNPKNFSACSGCKHIEEVPLEFESRYSDDDCSSPNIKSKMFHCNKLNKDLYPAIVLRKKLHLRYPEQFENQEQMPSECKFYTTANFGINDDDFIF